jgi:hypothetical protein
MKTNVSIELSDEERGLLADFLDNNETTRLATRKEITVIATAHIAGLVAMVGNSEPSGAIEMISAGRPASDIYKARANERRLMAHPDNPSYVRGWNLASTRKLA